MPSMVLANGTAARGRVGGQEDPEFPTRWEIGSGVGTGKRPGTRWEWAVMCLSFSLSSLAASLGVWRWALSATGGWQARRHF
jgi:hypothetical protein